jgi:hypothetical protein
MRLYKRNDIWWLDVSVNGQRFRISLDTTDKREARSLANKKIAQAEQGKLTVASQSFSRLAFGEAADKYLVTRKLELAPQSYAKEKQLLIRPREYSQATPLNKKDPEVGARTRFRDSDSRRVLLNPPPTMSKTC